MVNTAVSNVLYIGLISRSHQQRPLESGIRETFLTVKATDSRSGDVALSSTTVVYITTNRQSPMRQVVPAQRWYYSSLLVCDV